MTTKTFNLVTLGRRHVAVLTSESPDVLIGINAKEENCAFWNKLIPVLKDSKKEKEEEEVVKKPLKQSLAVHEDELESLVIDDLNRAETLFEPINSLRSQALLSAVDAGFKVVDVEEDDERERWVVLLLTGVRMICMKSVFVFCPGEISTKKQRRLRRVSRMTPNWPLNSAWEEVETEDKRRSAKVTSLNVQF